MAGALLGLLIYRPEIKLDAVTAFKVVDGNSVQYLFPMLFVTVACGAISGFHSLVGSGTTSKQIDNEADAKKIGYGGMLIEGGVLAVVALITAAYLTQGELSQLLKDGPVNVFPMGRVFMSQFGVPFEAGENFCSSGSIGLCIDKPWHSYKTW